MVTHSCVVRNRHSHIQQNRNGERQSQPVPDREPVITPTADVVTAIVPARNEEAVIGTCIESLAQPEIAQILVVNDQSSDATADVVRGCINKLPNLRLLDAGPLLD